MFIYKDIKKMQIYKIEFDNNQAEKINNWSELVVFFPFLVTIIWNLCNIFTSSYREQLMCLKLLLKKLFKFYYYEKFC